MTTKDSMLIFDGGELKYIMLDYINSYFKSELKEIGIEIDTLTILNKLTNYLVINEIGSNNISRFKHYEELFEVINIYNIMVKTTLGNSILALINEIITSNIKGGFSYIQPVINVNWLNNNLVIIVNDLRS